MSQDLELTSSRCNRHKHNGLYWKTAEGEEPFIVNYDGVVYQKDLGKNTNGIAKNMKIFDPDKTWNKVE